MNTPDHILIVDDDKDICQLVSDYLSKHNFKVSSALNGKAMWQTLETASIDLIVLDVMLPGEDGLMLCRDLRAKNLKTPIIMLSARGEEADRIVGLEIGADDYQTKPFSARELVARIKTILRRTRSLPPDCVEQESKQVKQWEFADWTLDVTHRHLIASNGLIVPLSGAEYRLLLIFLAHPQQILNRDQLLDLTQGKEASPFDRSIDVQISRLRLRLNDDSKEPRIIKTVRNKGYVLAVEVVKVV
ncbi:MAG: response regulator [Saezia sp.]